MIKNKILLCMAVSLFSIFILNALTELRIQNSTPWQIDVVFEVTSKNKITQSDDTWKMLRTTLDPWTEPFEPRKGELVAFLGGKNMSNKEEYNFFFTLMPFRKDVTDISKVQPGQSPQEWKSAKELGITPEDFLGIELRSGKGGRPILNGKELNLPSARIWERFMYKGSPIIIDPTPSILPGPQCTNTVYHDAKGNASWYTTDNKEGYTFDWKVGNDCFRVWFKQKGDDLWVNITTIPTPIADAGPDGITIMTYNLWMLPWQQLARDTGKVAQFFGAKTPLEALNTQADRRANKNHLPSYIGRINPDIIAFQEGFDVDGIKELLARLRDDHGYKYVYRPGNPPITTSFTGSGLVIVSKYPIDMKSAQVSFYREKLKDRSGNVIDEAIPCHHTDCMAYKGVIYAKVIKNGKPYHIFNTHTQAKTSDKKGNPVGSDIRAKQMTRIAKVIELQNIPPEEVVIVAGDWNMDQRRQRWVEAKKATEEILDATEVPLKGFIYTTMWDRERAERDKSRGAKIDYITYLNQYRKPIQAIGEIYPIWASNPYDDKRRTRLSDHLPIVASLKFNWSGWEGMKRNIEIRSGASFPVTLIITHKYGNQTKTETFELTKGNLQVLTTSCPITAMQVKATVSKGGQQYPVDYSVKGNWCFEKEIFVNQDESAEVAVLRGDDKELGRSPSITKATAQVGYGSSVVQRKIALYNESKYPVNLTLTVNNNPQNYALASKEKKDIIVGCVSTIYATTTVQKSGKQYPVEVSASGIKCPEEEIHTWDDDNQTRLVIGVDDVRVAKSPSL